MGEQWVRLICQVSKCVVNRDILDFEAGPRTGLIDPYFFLIQRIGIGQRTLKIIDAGSQVKYVMNVQFQSKFGIGAYGIATDDRIALAVETQVNIGLCQQA